MIVKTKGDPAFPFSTCWLQQAYRNSSVFFIVIYPLLEILIEKLKELVGNAIFIFFFNYYYKVIIVKKFSSTKATKLLK